MGPSSIRYLGSPYREDTIVPFPVHTMDILFMGLFMGFEPGVGRPAPYVQIYVPYFMRPGHDQGSNHDQGGDHDQGGTH